MALSLPHPGLALGLRPQGGDQREGWRGPCWACSLGAPLCPWRRQAPLGLLGFTPAQSTCLRRDLPFLSVGLCPPRSHCCPPVPSLWSRNRGVPAGSVPGAPQRHVTNGETEAMGARCPAHWGGGGAGRAPGPGCVHKHLLSQASVQVWLWLSSQTWCQVADLGERGRAGGASGAQRVQLD